MGPFATIELNAPGGVADYCARYGGFYRRLAADAAGAAVWDARKRRAASRPRSARRCRAAERERAWAGATAGCWRWRGTSAINPNVE